MVCQVVHSKNWITTGITISFHPQGETEFIRVSGRSRRRIVRGTSTISLLDPLERRGSLFSSPTAHQVDLFEDKWNWRLSRLRYPTFFLTWCIVLLRL